jgi:hypothetical protein
MVELQAAGTPLSGKLGGHEDEQLLLLSLREAH